MLDLGSNDLANGVGVDAISQTLYHFACSYCQQRSEWSLYCLCCLGGRAGLFGSSVEEFESDQLEYNICLKSICWGDVLFYKEKGYSHVQDGIKKWIRKWWSGPLVASMSPLRKVGDYIGNPLRMPYLWLPKG